MRAGVSSSRSHRQRLGLGRQKLLAEVLAGTAAAVGTVGVAVVGSLGRAIAVVHGRGVDTTARLVLSRLPSAWLAAMALGRSVPLLSGMLPRLRG